MSANGYIYCLSNESFGKTLFKIGFTTKNPVLRASQLYQTGTPMPFKIEFAKHVKKVHEKEMAIHLLLKDYRINTEREFFRVPIKTIKNAFNKIEGVWWRKNQQPHIKKTNHNNVVESLSLKRRRLQRKAKKGGR